MMMARTSLVVGSVWCAAVCFVGAARAQTTGQGAEPQAVESADEPRAWDAELRRWRREYVELERGERDRRAALQAWIERVRDPAALAALDALLKREQNHEVRALYARAVGNLEGEEALELLVRLAVQDESEYVRTTAAEKLAQRDDRQEAMKRFLRYLRNARYCDVAASALLKADMIPEASRYELPDRKLFLALTGSLVAFERRVVGVGKGYAYGRYLRPTGMGLNRRSWYGEFPIYYFRNRPLPHKNVLLVLTRLTGENYGYNRVAWERWYEGRRKSARDRP